MEQILCIVQHIEFKRDGPRRFEVHSRPPDIASDMDYG